MGALPVRVQATLPVRPCCCESARCFPNSATALWSRQTSPLARCYSSVQDKLIQRPSSIFLEHIFNPSSLKLTCLNVNKFPKFLVFMPLPFYFKILSILRVKILLAKGQYVVCKSMPHSQIKQPLLP